MSTQKQENTFSYYKSSKDEISQCCAKGCKESGTHRVLLDLNNPKKINYMCLDHIKEYNKNLNYYANMTAEEIESEIKADTIWRKPTWPFRGDARDFQSARDFFCVFEDRSNYFEERGRKEVWPSEIAGAAKVLGVSLPVEMSHLKKTYKQAVKEYHPDLHHGKKDREEKLKKINIAYKILSNFIKDAE